jgi:hypothetical protein
MKNTALILALLASASISVGVQAAPQGFFPPAVAVATATAVTLPASVVADRAAVSADLAAVATTRAKLVSDVAATAASSVIDADIAAYKTARMQLESDMYKLRNDAEPILTADEATLSLDRITLEITAITNNTAAHTAAQTQFATDRAQAEANRQAIFGNLCPTGYICADGSGHGGNGPQRGH